MSQGAAMNPHSFCRKMVSDFCKEHGLKVRNLQAVKSTSRFEVYDGVRVGSFEGCCKWSAIYGYLEQKYQEAQP